MSKEKQIEEMFNDMIEAENRFHEHCSANVCHYCEYYGDGECDNHIKAEFLYEAGYRKQSEWISVEERLPTEDEYLTHHNDGLDTLKRITVAYMTDTIEYTIGCYDGYKWMNQLGNKKINDVVAWKPFELYEAPKGGAE